MTRPRKKTKYFSTAKMIEIDRKFLYESHIDDDSLDLSQMELVASLPDFVKDVRKFMVIATRQMMDLMVWCENYNARDARD